MYICICAGGWTSGKAEWGKGRGGACDPGTCSPEGRVASAVGPESLVPSNLGTPVTLAPPVVAWPTDLPGPEAVEAHWILTFPSHYPALPTEIAVPATQENLDTEEAISLPSVTTPVLAVTLVAARYL